ncbi:glycoside hydrolase family 31 protein [Flindersiella endophytica]
MDSEGGLAFENPSGAVFRRDSPPRWEGAAWSHITDLTEGVVVTGLGGRSSRLDLSGRSYRLWNTDPQMSTYGRNEDPLSLSIPVYTVVADGQSHLAFYDNSFDGVIDIGTQTGAQISTRFTGGPLRYYVFPGTPAQAIQRYTALTGRPTLPPRWALGYHQSRWGYQSQSEVHRIAGEFAEHGLPLSAIWLDIDHLDANRPFAIDQRRFPDLDGLVTELGEHDVHLVCIADPGIGLTPEDPTYNSGLDADVFCRTSDGEIVRGVVWPGIVAFPDFTSAKTRHWWGTLFEEYLKLGVGGFWQDMNEPSSFSAWGDGTLPLSTHHDLDGRGGDHREAHNVYGLLMNRAAYEGLRDQRPDQRPFLLSRSGFAGLQRYAGTWTGDIGTSWDGLRISLTFTLGLGCCGIPFSGPDVGGFDRHPTPEMFLRWFQLAAWLPFFRVHCASLLPSREPWTWGTDVLELTRKAMRERYELLPYWYTLAWEAHRTGAPYVRPMLWADPDDPQLRRIEDQFMLGDALLIAPILHEGMRERTVRLPRGTWYDRRTGAVHHGPAMVSVEAGLDTTPVFVRAGSVIPVEHDGRIELHAYLPGGVDSTPEPGGRLISDPGDGYAEPIEERFDMCLDADNKPYVSYDGPAESLPYHIDWQPWSQL